MRRHPVRAALAGVAMVLAGGFVVAAVDGEGAGAPAPITDPKAAGAALVSTLRTLPLPDLAALAKRPASGPRFPIARVIGGERVELRSAPDGPVLMRLGHTTEFGSVRTFWVREIRGDWFGVEAPELANGQIGWIRDDRTRLDVSETRFWLLADRSERVLALYFGKRLLDRFAVTVGRPGSETPLGAFAITDALAGPSLGPYYGCCALALTGHQPKLPAGWFGGDRMAIHGTPGAIGVAASAGCLRTSDETMVSLFARVPLGAPVFVRA